MQVVDAILRRANLAPASHHLERADGLFALPLFR